MAASATTLNQAEIAVDSATPTCASHWVSTRFSARFMATAAKPIFTGVAVSPRAKKPGAKTFTST